MRSNQPKKKSLSASLKKKVVVSADPKYLALIRKVISEMWTKACLEPKEGRLVALAVDEAVSTIIHHAQGMKQPGDINIEFYLTDICFKAIIRDNTKSLDLNLLSERNKKIILKKEKRDQLSIFLILAIMDEITYQYKKGFQNEWQLIKFVTP